MYTDESRARAAAIHADLVEAEEALEQAKELMPDLAHHVEKSRCAVLYVLASLDGLVQGAEVLDERPDEPLAGRVDGGGQLT